MTASDNAELTTVSNPRELRRKSFLRMWRDSLASGREQNCRSGPCWRQGGRGHLNHNAFYANLPCASGWRCAAAMAGPFQPKQQLASAGFAQGQLAPSSALINQPPDHARPAQVPFHQITSHLGWPLSRKARQDAGRIAHGLQRQQKLHCSGGVAPKQRHHLGIAKPERKGRDHRCIPRRRKPAPAVILPGLAATP